MNKKEKIKKILILIESFLIIAGTVLIIVSSSLDLAKNGNDGINYLSNIVFLVFGGLGLLISFPMYSFYKTKDSNFLQPGYDYIINSIALSLVPTAIMYCININDQYFIDNHIDSALIYTLQALIIIYFNLYAVLHKNKRIIYIRFIPYALLIVCFSLYMYINRFMPYGIVGFSLIISALVIVIINTFLNNKNISNNTDVNKEDGESNRT